MIFHCGFTLNIFKNLSTAQMADSESGQTNDFNIGIHSFPAWHSALKALCGKQADKFTCCAFGKGS